MRTASEGAAGRHIRTLLESGEVGGLPDGRLLERFVTGDGATAEVAFAALVDRHGPMVWRACRAILADPNDADDAFQATFLVMVRRARSLWARESLGPWLLQVARRTSMRARSLAQRRRLREFTAAGLKPRLAAEPPPDELGAAIHEEVGRLPERYREVVVLCLLEGLPDSQVATRLGWPLGTVHSRLARGREKLRRGLTRRGLAPAVAALASSRAPTEAASAAVPARLIEATVRSASRLASLGLRDAALPAAVAALTEGVLRMTWIATIQSAALSLAAVGCVAVAALASPGEEQEAPDPAPKAGSQEIPNPPAAETPIPTSSVVDVVVRSASRPDSPVRSLGTVVASTPEASFVLTSFNGVEIAADSAGKSQVRGEIRVAGVVGESVDVEPTSRLALLRFRPGRLFPTARVLPRNRPLSIGQNMALVDGFDPAQVPSTRPARILELSGTEPPEAGQAGPPGVLALLCDASPPGVDNGGAGLFLKAPDGSPPLGDLAGVFQLILPERPRGMFIGPEAIHRLLDRNGLGRAVEPKAAPTSLSASPPPSPKVEESATAAMLASTVSVIAFDGNEPGSRSYAAGTVISSTSDRSIVLTSAHIVLGRAADAPGGRKKVMETIRVVLDTKDSPQGAFAAEAIQVDEDRDLAALRIRPGAIIPTARVAPPSRRLVVGAPASRLDRPDPDRDRPLEVKPTTIVALDHKITNRASSWTSCTGAPKGGLSGSGLFVADSVAGGASPILVGLCNYADPATDRGFYASPDMIYAALDAAGLSALYQDEASNAPPPEVAGSEIVKQGFVALAVEGAVTPIALGTVISSTEEESIALTAGSIFAGPGDSPADPKRFDRKVTVYYPRPRTEHSVSIPPVWGTAGEVVDYDVARNVGLVRFRPGRKLQAMGIVPTSWKPTRGASAFRFLNLSVNEAPGAIREPSVMDKLGAGNYEAIECEGAPARTNVGAPLIVMASDDKSSAIAGVCNYSSPQDAAGYYAAPAMIYHILDANGLSDLYRKGNEAFGLAPPLPFNHDRRPPTVEEPERIDRVERRVDEMDRKLDRILEALERSTPR
ncbi:MAG: hypothetical protein BGO49_00120 [Planctomycetales bacterium 71-10]|nr:MAG: hypothetical protein BGO49_00120 [Planctomycetales bacterium 71-10]